jgi:hypothetical protein
VVVTPSKLRCDSFVAEKEMSMNDFDLSDFADECSEDANTSMEIEQDEQMM